jgi:hypothetical protein
MVVRFLALRAGRSLPPGRFLILISDRSLIDPRAIMRLEGLGQSKNPIFSSGMEPATSQIRYRVPPDFLHINITLVVLNVCRESEVVMATLDIQFVC